MKECGMLHSSIQLAARLLGKLERFTRILGNELAFVHSCLECLTCNFVQVIGSPVVPCRHLLQPRHACGIMGLFTFQP